MKKLYFNSKANNLFFGYFSIVFLLLGISLTTTAQLRVPFTQRTSQYTPDKRVYNVKGDFTIMGNTNMTLQSYGDQTQNGNNTMIYVDVDGNTSNGVDGKPTFNSSRSTLTFSTENGAVPSCSNIIYAGLYWSGRASDSNPSNNSFSVTKNINGTSVTKNFDKRNISLKGPNATTYTQFSASATDIYYPTTSDGFMFSAYKEVTDYVRANGIGEYTAADLAVNEGNGGGTGFYGGWSLIVVYENSKMKYRDVTIFDGHAYVTGGTASFEIPVTGFNTVQAGPVGVKLGLMAGEGDNGISGDYFEIKKQSDNTFLRLSHAGNSTGNFFTSAIQTGGNARTPNLVNNTGLDISMFNIPNTNNSVLTNNQTSTTFRYGSTQDTYVIFAIAMAVDAYIPEVENILTATTVNNVPVTTEPYISLPGQDVGFNIDIKNLGTEAINNYRVVVPIPYNASYVPGSAVGTILFTPLPTPNTVTFDPTLGATGSIVWNIGTLPLGANPSTLLAKLSFKLKTTTDCSILLNPTCGSPIFVTASSSGAGAITGTSFAGTRAIKGYTNNGACIGQPILETLAIGINGANYVAANCQNTPLIRNFGFCNTGSTIGTSAISANFPPGSTFYNEFPVTLNSIQYSDANPFPLVAGSTTTYYALPPNTTGCFFPFTISKCKVIDAVNDSIGPINGTTGNTNAGNIFNNNGSGIDTLGGNLVLITQVNLTVLTPATPINGGFVPSIDLLTGNIIVPAGTPAGVYTIVYQICEKITPTNCDSATVTICVGNAPISGGDQVACQTSPAQTLTATATAPGQTIVWYNALTNGNIVASPTLNTVGTVTYYAQANVGNCSFPTRTPVTLTINPASVVPVSGGNQTECEASPLQTLTATATVPAGSTVVWYNAATNGSIVTNPTLNAVGSVTYYAQAVNGNNCSSLSRTAVTLTINPASVVPVSGGNQTECEASPLQTLTATATVPAGSTVVWYNAATNGSIVTNPTLNTVGSVTYYAQAVNANNCSSLSRTAVTLTINPASLAPVTGGDQTECEASPLQTLTATATVPVGSTVVWYDAATGGNVLVTAPTLNAVGSITYYAQAVNANNCSSLSRTAVTLTINAAPVAPITGGDQTECEASPLQTLTATATVPVGSTVVWYDAATGGNVLVTAPTLNAVGSVTYYAQAVNANNCSSLSRTPVTLTINAAPVAPITGGDQTECEASPLQTLTATATVPAGQTVVWYDAATGGNVLVTAPTLNAVGSVTYYAQAVNANNCSSLSRTAVTLTINAAPVAPVTGGDQTECEASPLQTLTATATVPVGSTVVWYDAATGGNVLVTAPTLNAVGSITYYAQAVNANNCSSLSRTAVTLTINAAPVAPVTGGDQTECEASPLQTLTATATVPAGQAVVWYDAAVNGSIVTNPTLNAVGSITYFAAANGGTCESLDRTPVTLTINPAPVAPVTGGDQTECEASPLQTLTATATVPVGSTVVWYDAATGGNALVTAPTLNAVGSVTYYAQAVNANNCSSLSRTAVTLTINPAPVAPVTGGDQTECEASPLQTLTATATVPVGSTVVWYDAATGGNVLVTAPTLNAVGSITYYAQAVNANNCSSLSRTAVTLTINAAPVAPITGGDQTECEASPLQTLTATATVPAGQTVVWYDAAVNGSIVTNPTLNAVGSITYFAAANGGTCVSLDRTPVTLTINPAPVAPVTGGDQTECEASPLQTLTATATVPVGSTVVWYDAATGGNVLVTAPTLNAVGSITYYAQAVNANNCSSLSRTAVTLTINAAPVAPVTGGDQTECEASPLQTLTATATVPVGSTVVWYDAATGGNVLVTAPTLNAVGSITYYAQAVNANNCSSLSRTAVTLTINAAPVAPVTGGDQTECEASPLQTLTATATVPVGQAVVWYDAATGGNVLVTAPTLNAVGSITYYAQAVNSNNCSSLSRTAVTLTINPAPVAPVTGGDQTECEASPLQTLTATATVPVGSTVVWYDAATGGNVLVTAPTLNAVGSITYYAQAVNANNCSSLSRTAVTLTINPAPVAPVTGGDQTECEASPLQTLTATATVPAGQTVVWYDAAVNGSIVTNPTLNAVGSITYFAAANGGTCVSLDRTPVTLTINPAPVAPITGGDQTECEASPLQTLTATATVPAGQTVVWYDAAVNGSIVTNPTLNAVGSITYYAQAVNANNCSSLSRTAVTLTINAAPVAPVTGGDQTECEASPLQTLTATATVPVGSTVVWYDAATGGNVLVTAPTLNAVGSITYYAQAVNANNCSSLSRTAVTLTINPAPLAPVTGGNQTECETSPLQTLTATATVPSGQAVVWYDAATGGTIVTNPTLNAIGSITYFAAANGGTCESLDRTPVTLTINPAPVAPVTGGDQTECEASPLQTLTATATVPVGSTVVWYDAATGGNVLVTAPTLNAVGSITYYAQAVNANNCSSLSRTAVTLTINPAPLAPVTGGNQTECETSPLQTLTATATVPAGSTVVWYDAATGGNVLVTAPTLNAVGSITYYAQAVNANNCSSLSRTPVTLTINPAPVAPVTGGDQTECEASPLQTLTATATVPVGSTVVWYDAATGGNVLVTAPTLNAVGSITYYAQAVNANNCSSLSRTAVTLTINPAPVAPVTGGDQTECEASPLQTLTATATVPVGSTVVWYDAATGGNVLVTAPTLNAVGSITYYAQAVNANNCSSLSRTPVTLTINPAPVAPVTGGDQTECEASPLQTLTATATVPSGQAVVWYDAATGGTIVTNPTLNAIGSITYFAAANGGTCESLDRTPVTLTINPAPVAPVTGGDQTECEASPLQTLTATATVPAGSTVVWYDAATGGNVLVTAPTLNAVGSITYYAQAVNANNCSSLSRTAVTLTINPAPVAPVTGGDQTECEASPLQTLTATATVPVGSTVVWYDAATGGNVLVTAPTLNAVGSITYYAQAVNSNNCSSLSRTAVTLTINAAPVAPVTGGDQTECEASPLQTLTATATVPAGQAVVWYDAATGGNVTSPTLNAVGSITYYAQAVNIENCSSLTRTPVTLTINPASTVPVSGGDQTECETSPIQTLTATSTVPAGSTVVWYNAANGGTIVTSPTLNSVGTVTYYAQATSAENCASLTRTAVTLTIKPIVAVPLTGAVTNPTCAIATGSFSITNFNINNTYDVSPNTGVSISSTGIVTAPAGTYVITTSSNGCTSGNSLSITIDAQPQTPTAAIVGTVIQPTCALATGSVVLSGLPSGNWNINPGNISGTTSFTTISGLSAGTYNFTVTNTDGCTSAASDSVIIDAQPETPAAPALGTVTGPTCTIATGSVVLNDLPAGSWTINPGNINGNTTSITISDLAPGTYNYTVTNSDGCTSSTSADVVIDEEPSNPTIVVNSAAANCNNDDEITFDLNTFLPTGTPLTGSWSTENSSANGGLIGSEFSPYLIEVGTYLFSYEAFDDGGCAVKVDLNMTVDDDCTVLSECTEPFVHNAFSPNGDDINEFFVINQLDQFTCFPTNTVEIYNRWGVLVFEINQYDNNTRVFRGISEGRVTVDKGAQLPTGTYFYVLNYTTKEGENKHQEGYLFLNQ